MLPHGKGFDLSFKTQECLREFWCRFKIFEVEKLSDESLKVVIVKMYNELVNGSDRDMVGEVLLGEGLT